MFSEKRSQAGDGRSKNGELFRLREARTIGIWTWVGLLLIDRLGLRVAFLGYCFSRRGQLLVDHQNPLMPFAEDLYKQGTTLN